MGRIILWWKASEVSDLLLFGFLGEEYCLDVGQYTTLGNGDTGEKFVQLFVITDGELKMAGDDSGLLVVTGSVTSEFKNLSSEVLHNGSQVDWCTSTDTFGIVSFTEKTVDTSNGELKSSPGATGL